MKKLLPLILFAALTLTSCGKQPEPAATPLPKLIYADAPAVTAPPTPAADSSWQRLNAPELPSRLSELYIMDEGYMANAVASIGDTLLAADLDEPDYELVLAHFRQTDDGTMELTDKSVLMTGGKDDAYEQCLYGVCSSPDGYYYVLSGEAPRKALSIDVERNVSIVGENPDYSGKYRVIKYSAQGERLAAVDIPDLPIDAPGIFMADSGGRITVFGFDYKPEAGELQYHVIESASVSVLDFIGGGYNTVELGLVFVYSACPWNDGALVFAEKLEPDWVNGLYRLDLNSGELQKLIWPYLYGQEVSPYRPFCFYSNNKIYLNNQSYYGSFEPESMEYEPLLSAIPEGYSAVPQPPDYKGYPYFDTCCRVGEHTFIGAVATGSEPLYVLSPVE